MSASESGLCIDDYYDYECKYQFFNNNSNYYNYYFDYAIYNYYFHQQPQRLVPRRSQCKL